MLRERGFDFVIPIRDLLVSCGPFALDSFRFLSPRFQRTCYAIYAFFFRPLK